MADWSAKWPTGCQGQPRGYLPMGDPPDNPILTVGQYHEFLADSECRAHTVDLQCARALPKAPGCDRTIEDYIQLTEQQRDEWCPSRLRHVLAGAGLGLLAGGAIGAAVGGLPGALIGAGIGAVVGGIAGLFL